MFFPLLQGSQRAVRIRVNTELNVFYLHPAPAILIASAL